MKRFVLLLVGIVLVFGSAPAFAQKFSGLVFMDYFHNVGRDTNFVKSESGIPNKALSGQKDLYGFQLRRIFFTVDYDLTPSISSRFRIEADGASLTANSKATTYVKDMYVKAKDVFKGHDVIVGVQSTIGYGVSESVWNYRSVEKTQMDLRGVLSSRDFAATMQGKIDDEGMFNYAVQYGNATDQNESDKYKRVSALAHVKPIKNLNVTVYGEQKWAKGDTTNTTNLAFSAGYMEKEKYGAGVEYFMSSKAKSFTKTDAKELSALSATGLSFYGHYFIMPELVGLVRFDIFDPNSDSDDKAKYDSRNLLFVGADWKVSPKFSIIPNVGMEMFEDVVFKDQAGKETTFKTDASLNARLTFVLKLE